VKRFIFGAFALSILLAGCGGAASGSSPQKLVPDTSLTASLATADELNAIMGTSGMVAHTPVSQMGDHRNLLPNVNCLGVWQVNEAPIYESSHWKSVRQQMVREPDADNWNFLVVQSVVSYRTADGARQFLTESADRWSKCSNHTLNIQLNGQALPGWRSGDLTKTDNRLALPYTRTSGDQVQSCQRVLQVAANVVLDIQACRPQQQGAFTAATDIADKIVSKFPR
jgi:hypothetical protein